MQINIKQLLLLGLVIGLLQGLIIDCNAQNLDQMIDDLDYLSNRDTILTQNIANVDTPNYMPHDLNQTNSSHNIGLYVTHSGHLQLEHGSKYGLTDGKVKEYKPNGNAINLEYEMSEKDLNAAKFHEISNVYNKARNVLKSAAGTGAR